MATLPNFPAIRPSFLLDFANSRRADPRLSVVRGTIGTINNAAGQPEVVPANSPRIDFDPASGRCLGLLAEESAVNLLTFPNDFANAAWVKPAGVVVGAKDSDGYTDITIEALGSGFHSIGRQDTQSSAGSHTFGLDIAPGTLTRAAVLLGINGTTNYIRIIFTDIAAGTFTTQYVGTVTAANASVNIEKNRNGVRVNLSVTLAGANFISTIVYPSVPGAQVLGSIKIRNAQATTSAAKTSYIPATNAQVARAADAVTIAIQPGLVKTIIAEVVSYAGYPVSGVPNDRRHVFSLTPASLLGAGEHFYLFLTGDGLYCVCRNLSGTLTTQRLVTAAVSSGIHKVGVVLSGSSVQGVIDGVAGPVYAGILANSGSALNTLTLGAQQGPFSRFLNGALARIAAYDAALSEAQLQRLTA